MSDIEQHLDELYSRAQEEGAVPWNDAGETIITYVIEYSLPGKPWRIWHILAEDDIQLNPDLLVNWHKLILDRGLLLWRLVKRTTTDQVVAERRGREQDLRLNGQQPSP